MSQKDLFLTTLMKVMEARDNHIEYHTLSSFMEFCLKGRPKYNEQTNTALGHYFEDGNFLIDQPFSSLITDGEIRILIIGDIPQLVIHKIPAPGGLSCVGGLGTVYKTYKPDCHVSKTKILSPKT